MSRTAVKITLDAFEQALLEKITRQLSVPNNKKQRVRVVLCAATGQQNQAIAHQIGLNRNDVGKWRTRWATYHQAWQQSDPDQRPKMNARLVLHWLNDQEGRGRKNTITLEQRTKIAALCQEPPEHNDIPVTHWTLDYLAQAAVKRGIISTISRVSVHRILKKTTYRPIEADIG